MSPLMRSLAAKPDIAVLRSMPLLSGLSVEHLQWLAPSLERASYPRDAMIVGEGEAGDAMFLVVSGRVKVAVFHESGREVILSVVGPKDFFGEMSLFDRKPRSASVQALEPCELVRLRRDAFLQALAHNHDMALALISALVARLRDADRKIEDLSLIDVSGRVARLLLDECQEVDGEYVVRPSITRAEIARMVGASREMVSRVMTAFEKRGRIRTSGRRIYVLDAELLRARRSIG